MIHGNANGRAATTGGRLSREGEFRCVELATRPNCITVRAHATLIILILVRTFRAYPRISSTCCRRRPQYPQIIVRRPCAISMREAKDLSSNQLGGNSYLCICAFAHLCGPFANKTTEKQQIHRRHHLMGTVPQ